MSAGSYQHGGNPEADFRRLGLAPRDLIDLSVNTNPLGPPDSMQRIWNKAFRAVRRYPSQEGEALRDFYVRKFSLPHDSILPGNGSIDLMYLASRVLDFERAVAPAPSFHDYTRACDTAGKAVDFFQLYANDGFRLEPGAIAAFARKNGAGAVFLGNPNNPTGAGLSADSVLEQVDARPEQVWFVDEAFIQFVPDIEKATLLRETALRPNLVVFHSLTKFYAIAGLRAGAAVSHPETIARLRAAAVPWQVNNVMEACCEALYDVEAYERETLDLVAREREAVRTALEAVEGIEVYPGRANFLLFRINVAERADELMRGMMERGLYLRDCSNFAGLGPGYFRIAITTQERRIRALQILREAVAAL
ncbi:MAG: pyridoxal phosphate-dependent aminotransferase [Opitutales bacterium]